ncbi:MAG: hypothetical protein DRQ97_13515 [Gammaproteobacteria bacterium]|nr:MAG: hypothetical protein DRQ97_13515 [Gammaproteobacteria bacterium]
MDKLAADSRTSCAYHADSVEMLGETYRAAPVDYVQIAPGRLGADIHSVSTTLVEVREVSFETGVLLTIENPFPRFALGIGLRGQSQLFRSPLTNSNIAYANGHNGIIARVQSASSWCNISIDPELLEQVATTHHYVIPGGDASHGLSIEAQSALVSTISQVARTQHFAELSDAQFDDEIALIVLRVLNPSQNKGSARLSQQYIIVQRIFEYIHAHFSERMTVTGLCQLAGISERTLQYTFLEVTGLTVQQYLMSYRLHQARALLAGGEVVQVKDAAQACGIPHAGRFSQYFKAMFGESPGQVLLTL